MIPGNTGKKKLERVNGSLLLFWDREWEQNFPYEVQQMTSGKGFLKGLRDMPIKNKAVEVPSRQAWGSV